MTRMLGPQDIVLAADMLLAGELVALPTETVYGLAGDATNEQAVAAIFAAKGRPHFNPLILHVADRAAAAAIGVWNDRASRLARRFWPGPLTLVLPRRDDAGTALLASAGLDTVAIRCPDHPLAAALLRAVGRALAAPSANRSGRVSPTSADDVAGELSGRITAIMDGGPCRVGLESTIVDLTGADSVLLRPGGLAVDAIEAVIGPLARASDGRIRAPGMLISHYAPGLPVRLDAGTVEPDEALVTFGPSWPPGAARTEHLSPGGDTAEAAARLFQLLRLLDRPDYSAIAVMPVPERGLGAAINDRLRRAAAPREGRRPAD